MIQEINNNSAVNATTSVNDDPMSDAAMAAAHVLQSIWAVNDSAVESAPKKVVTKAPGEKSVSSGDFEFDSAYTRLLQDLMSHDLKGAKKFIDDLRHLSPAELKSAKIQNLLKSNQKWVTLLTIEYFKEFSFEDTDGQKGLTFLQDKLFTTCQPLIDAMSIVAAGADLFIKSTTFIDPATGAEYRGWLTSANGTILRWTPGGKSSVDKLIQDFISRGQSPGAVTSDPFEGFESVIMQLWKKEFMEMLGMAGNNVGYAMMVAMLMFDGNFQGKQGTLSDTLGLTTTATDGTVTPLINLINKGTLTDADIQSFMDAFTSLEAMGKAFPEFAPFSDTIESAWQSIRNIAVNFGGAPIPLGTLIDSAASAIRSGDQAAITKAFSPLKIAISNLGVASQPLVASLQQVSGVLTGRSKEINTELAALSQLSNQATELGSGVASGSKPWVQYIMTIIKNFRQSTT